jgi:drug/metabolite transporter (DMT)-like permease
MTGRLAGLLLVICSTLLEAIGQLFLKNSTSAGKVRLKKSALLACGLCCLAVEAVLWMCVLRLLPVAIAYPLGSLSFVAITVISLVVLKERITKERWLGVSFIICGAALVGLVWT